MKYIFFEIFGHHIEVNTINSKLHITGTLNTLQNQLESFGFIRVHKKLFSKFKTYYKLRFKKNNYVQSGCTSGQ